MPPIRQSNYEILTGIAAINRVTPVTLPRTTTAGMTTTAPKNTIIRDNEWDNDDTDGGGGGDDGGGSLRRWWRRWWRPLFPRTKCVQEFIVIP